MSILNLPFVSKRTVTRDEKIVSTLAFDLLMTALTAWFVGGLYLDGWAHIHLSSALETFFTPWHGVLYSGFLASAAFLVAALIRNLTRGYPLTRALPVGYNLSLVGVVIFFCAGVGDMIWHLVFGIEVSVEALLSPTHLFLAFGGALILTGPIRAALARANETVARLPLLLATTLLLSLFTFFTEYASPFAETVAGLNHRADSASTAFHFEALGIAGILLQSALLMGLVLFLLRRRALPFGSLTLMLGVNTALMAFMHDEFFSTGPLPICAVGILSGFAGDVLIQALNPSPTREFSFRVFAFALPFVQYALYFGALLAFGGGIWWTVHLWTGAIVLAGVVGWLSSYAFLSSLSSAV